MSMGIDFEKLVGIGVSMGSYTRPTPILICTKRRIQTNEEDEERCYLAPQKVPSPKVPHVKQKKNCELYRQVSKNNKKKR